MQKTESPFVIDTVFALLIQTNDFFQTNKNSFSDKFRKKFGQNKNLFQTNLFSFQTLVFFFSDYNMNEHCRITNEIVMSDNRVEEVFEEMDIDEDPAFTYGKLLLLADDTFY